MHVSRMIEYAGADPGRGRWRDMYRIGCVACIALPVSIAAAVIAYVIWPYTPGLTSLHGIYAALHENLLGGLMSLDFMMVLFLPVMVLQLLALYVALRPVNESFALVALVVGLMGNVLIFTARPLVEMTYLAEQYAAATTDAARARYLAAGEALHALFNGTTWILWNVLTCTSYAISSLLMLRSAAFTRVTAYLGIVLTVIGIGFLLPAIGTYLSLAGTIGSLVWYPLLAKAFYRLGWGPGASVATVSDAATAVTGAGTTCSSGVRAARGASVVGSPAVSRGTQ